MIDKVPQTWRIADLGKIAKEFLSGGTPSTKEAKFWDGDIPWTTSALISETDIFLDCGQRFITHEGLENSASHLVPKGNLLVGTRVGVGKAVVNLIDIAISQDLTGIVLNSSVNPAFIAYQFKTQRVTSFFFGRKRGTTIKGIARLDLHALPLSIPPLTEQQAIVQALQAVQEAREARRRETALERERKAALMEYLFTHGTHGEPRQQTEIGEIPQSWRVEKLGKIVTLQRGKDLPVQNRNPGSIPVIGSNGIVGWHNQSAEHVPIPGVATGRSGSIGLLTYEDRPYWPLNTVLYVSNFHGNDPLFIYYWLHLFDFKRYSQGVSVPTLNKNMVSPVPFPLPPLQEQKVIANAMQACDTKIAALEQEAALLEELFRAMLEELMTGRLSALPLA
jgi:type I restriction enzyme S subunit